MHVLPPNDRILQTITIRMPYIALYCDIRPRSVYTLSDVGSNSICRSHIVSCNSMILLFTAIAGFLLDEFPVRQVS